MEYFFREGEAVVMEPEDAITLECVYDNSAANQPVVGGVPRTPQDVTWGEGTFDEMCLMYLGVVTPLEEDEAPADPEAGVCAPARPCFEACPDASAGCLLNCPEVNTACLSCAAQGLVRCGGVGCVPELRAAQACLSQCGVSEYVFGGSYGACMRAECPETWDAITTCLDPLPGQEACQPALRGCGL
jgi:hypothetical protein